MTTNKIKKSKRLVLTVVIIGSAFFGGCVGTTKTRLMNPQVVCQNGPEGTNGSFIGAYPFEGSLYDLEVLHHNGHWLGGPGGMFDSPMPTFVGLFSLPFDVVFDAILTPADCIGWSCGLRKNTINDIKEHDTAKGF